MHPIRRAQELRPNPASSGCPTQEAPGGSSTGGLSHGQRINTAWFTPPRNILHHRKERDLTQATTGVDPESLTLSERGQMPRTTCPSLYKQGPEQANPQTQTGQEWPPGLGARTACFMGTTLLLGGWCRLSGFILNRGDG